MLRKRWTGSRMSGMLALATLVAVAASGLAVAHAAQKKATSKRTASSARSTQTVPTLSAMLQRPVEDLNAVTLPDGTQMVDLEGGFQNVLMASFDADGNLVVACVDDLAVAEGILLSRNLPRPVRSKAKESGKKSLKQAPVTLEEK